MIIERVSHRIELLRDPVTRGWLVVTAGSVVRLAIGFIPSIIIARTFGPSRLGVYALLAALATTMGAVCDLGLTEAAVKRIAPAWIDAPELAKQRARSFFWIRLGTTAMIVALGLLLAGPIAARWRGIGHDSRLLALALLGVAGTALSGAVSGILQASGHFGRLSIVMITNALLTACFAVILVLSGHLTIATVLAFLGIGTSLACFMVGRHLLPAGIVLTPPNPWSLLPEARALFSFGIWVWIANSFAMLAAQLDLFLAGSWLAPAAVGSYALALNLASKADVVNQSLHAALLPSASALANRHEVRVYLRRGLARSAIIAALLLPLVPLSRPLITLFFGAAYGQAALLFPALLGVAIFDVFTAPFLLLVFPTNRPRILAAADGLRCTTLVIGAIVLVPLLGVYGLVIAKLAARVIGVAMTAILLGRNRAAEWQLEPEGAD